MWAFDEVQAERLLLPTPFSLSGQLLPILLSQAPVPVGSPPTQEDICS